MIPTIVILAFLSLGAALPLSGAPRAGPIVISGFSSLPVATPVSKPEAKTGVIPSAWRHTHGTLTVPGQSSSAPTATTTAAASKTNTKNFATSFTSATSAATTASATTASVAAATTTASASANIGDMVLQARHNTCCKFCKVNPRICPYCIPGEETHLEEGAHKRAEQTAEGKDPQLEALLAKGRPWQPEDDEDNGDWQYEIGDCIPGFSWGC